MGFLRRWYPWLPGAEASFEVVVGRCSVQPGIVIVWVQILGLLRTCIDMHGVGQDVQMRDLRSMQLEFRLQYVHAPTPTCTCGLAGGLRDPCQWASHHYFPKPCDHGKDESRR